ncbi:LacI family DNA-binding transcriptional regulator [Sedimenticola sp.]|uniref:LacI family DNA-binding transcriptional regulator n=1 Tax=Sedimenticola sp. TaxID=1940285 RepID=UPI003D0EC0CF
MKAKTKGPSNVVPPTGRPTLKDIAGIAGVSVGTVSAALNNRPSVAMETRALVIDVATSIGYELKSPSQQLPDTNLKVIGLLVKHDVGMAWEVNPFYSQVQLGVTNTCHSHNISLMVANIEVDASNHPVDWPTMINEQRIDGLIMAGTFIDDTVQMVRRKVDIPIVLVDSYAPELPFDSIVTDNEGGAQKAVRYLVESGHTRIGLAGWNSLSPPSIQQRKLGYDRVLAENGLEPFIVETNLSRDGGETAVLQLLGSNKNVTAIFCCNDETALGAMSAARELGLEIPRDLSVIGFDNIGLAGETTPALTTVHAHKSWMGTLGVRALIERARNPRQPQLTTMLSTYLVIRETVSSPAH